MLIALETSFTWSRLVVRDANGSSADLASDRLSYMSEAYRLHEVEVPSAGGAVRVVVGPRNPWSFGAKIMRGDQTLWQSHENPHGYLVTMQGWMNSRHAGSDSGADAQPAFDAGVWKRNAPSIACDIALGLLFFIMGKVTDLRTAALVTAVVGLSLVPIQWLVNRFLPRPVDLLGGLALFGVFMMLLSAGFSWYYESEFAVQLKTTVLGGITASLFAIDALLDGRYLARRFATYIGYRDLDLQRLAIGMAGSALIMATLNLAVALSFSKDTWLNYTTWVDLVIVIVLTQYVISWSRRQGNRLNRQ